VAPGGGGDLAKVANNANGLGKAFWAYSLRHLEAHHLTPSLGRIPTPVAKGGMKVCYVPGSLPHFSVYIIDHYEVL